MLNKKLRGFLIRLTAYLAAAALNFGVPQAAYAKNVSNEVGTPTEWIEGEPIENPTNTRPNPDAELYESVESSLRDSFEGAYEVSGAIESQYVDYSDSELFNFDEKVHRLKENLMDLGYMERDIITDVYDPYTQLGVMFFQRDNGLAVTGVADDKTIEAVAGADALPYELREGAEGEDVKQLQNALQSLGYSLSSTGVYDSATIGGVKKYAADRNITINGDNTPASLLKTIYDDAVLHGDSTAIETDTATAAADARVEALISVAEQQLGKPYVLGGKGPDVFDCSGLVYYCLNQSGYDIGYMTSSGWASSSFETIEAMENLRRGDIVCFKGHVGIYLGDGLMLDASSSQGKIRITSDIRKTAYWLNTFLYGKRVF